MRVRILSRGLVIVSFLLVSAAMDCAAQGMLSIEGTATYRERIALPPNAIFEAALEDVTRTTQVIGQARIDQPGSPPFHFTIEYDPTQIRPDHLYSVQARITVNGSSLFTTDQRYQVLTQGHGSVIGMMMMRRAEGGAGTPPDRSLKPLCRYKGPTGNWRISPISQ